MNPLGYVPALVLDDGTLLTEGAAIVQYIADLVPAKTLAPPNGTIERVKLPAWLNFFANEMHIASPIYASCVGTDYSWHRNTSRSNDATVLVITNRWSGP